MTATRPILTIHRAASEIGGNCIELEFDGHRLLLDAGSPLTFDVSANGQTAIPRTLNTSGSVDALVISHPHQDHDGLLRELPRAWPVWCGAAAEVLIRMTASISGAVIQQHFHNHRAYSVFNAGPFSIVSP